MNCQTEDAIIVLPNGIPVVVSLNGLSIHQPIVGDFLRGCWYKMKRQDPWSHGQFHRWGSEIDGENCVTVGVIETDDHEIVTPDAKYVSFKESIDG